MSHSRDSISSPNYSPNWTAEQYKLFETGLAIFDQEGPDRWRKIANMVGGGTTEDEVKRQYEILLQDIDHIETGKIPLPKYKKNRRGTAKGNSNTRNEEQRLENLRL